MWQLFPWQTQSVTRDTACPSTSPGFDRLRRPQATPTSLCVMSFVLAEMRSLIIFRAPHHHYAGQFVRLVNRDGDAKQVCVWATGKLKSLNALDDATLPFRCHLTFPCHFKYWINQVFEIFFGPIFPFFDKTQVQQQQ